MQSDRYRKSLRLRFKNDNGKLVLSDNLSGHKGTPLGEVLSDGTEGEAVLRGGESRLASKFRGKFSADASQLFLNAGTPAYLGVQLDLVPNDLHKLLVAGKEIHLISVLASSGGQRSMPNRRRGSLGRPVAGVLAARHSPPGADAMRTLPLEKEIAAIDGSRARS
jgi:hypothetical protein